MEGQIPARAMQELADPENQRRAVAELNQGLDLGAEKYAALPGPVKAILSGVAMVTMIGPPVLRYLKDRFTDMRIDRAEEMLRTLSAGLEEQKQRVDQEFVNSPPYGEMVISAIEASTRSYRKEKIHLLAQALASAALTSDRDTAFREMALRWVADLEVEHMHVLQTAHKQLRVAADMRGSAEEGQSTRQTMMSRGAFTVEDARSHGLDDVTVRGLLFDLEARGLIEDGARGTYLAMQGDRSWFRITDLGESFVDFLLLSDPAAPAA